MIVLDPRSISEADFLRIRPPVAGYEYHGSADGDVAAVEPYHHTRLWGDGLGLATTTSWEEAVRYAMGLTAQGERRALARERGRVNYVLGSPARILDFDVPADRELWEGIADALGIEPPSGWYLEVGRPFTNLAAFQEAVTDYDADSSGSEGIYAVEEALAERFDATTRDSRGRTVRIYKNPDCVRVVPPSEVFRALNGRG